MYGVEIETHELLFAEQILEETVHRFESLQLIIN